MKHVTQSALTAWAVLAAVLSASWLPVGKALPAVRFVKVTAVVLQCRCAECCVFTLKAPCLCYKISYIDVTHS